MPKSGLTHIDVGPELTRTEWESEDTHALINGTAFPGTPVERQLFYRNDLHLWYVYNGTAWEPLQSTAQIEGHRVMEVHALDQPPAAHDNTKHSTNYATESAFNNHSARHELAGADVISVAGLSGELADDQPPKSHDNTKHTTNYASDHDLSTHVGTEAAPVHGSTDAATAAKVVHRDAAGRAKVANPSVDADIDNQGSRNTAIETHRTGATHALDQPPASHDNTKHSTNYATESAFNNHSARHELAGADVLSVAGLSGELADDQPPKSHDNTKHSVAYAPDADLTTHEGTQAAGVHGSTNLATASKLVHRDASGRARVAPPSHADDIDTFGARVAGIGVHKAAEVHDLDQPPAAHDNTKHSTNYATESAFNNHSARHELGGADVLSVAGLSGELAADQPPKSHDNAKHSTAYTAESVFNAHRARHEWISADELRLEGLLAARQQILAVDWQTVAQWTAVNVGGAYQSDTIWRLMLITSAASGDIAKRHTSENAIPPHDNIPCMYTFLIQNWGFSQSDSVIWLGLFKGVNTPGDTEIHVAFKIINGVIYASSSDGAVQEITNTSDNGMATNAWRQKRLSFSCDTGGEVKFYIADSLAATHTTRLPPRWSSTSRFILQMENTAAVVQSIAIRAIYGAGRPIMG